MTTRQEHLQWCKDRALAYVEAGDLNQAFASMGSDLNAHDETKGSVSAMAAIGMPLLMGGHLSTPDSMRDFINGFN